EWMEVQLLYPHPIQSQPRLDICVFGVTRSRIRISLLNFARTFAIDVLQHRRKRNAKDRPLHSAPATMVGQRLSKLENFTGNFHSRFVRTRIVGQPLRLPTTTEKQAMRLPSCLHDFA